MPTLTIEYQTDSERLMLEQAVAHVQAMTHLALDAPHGTVLAACESLALTDGRRLVRDHLAAALQLRADATDAQKKPTSGRRGDAPAGS